MWETKDRLERIARFLATGAAGKCRQRLLVSNVRLGDIQFGAINRQVHQLVILGEKFRCNRKDRRRKVRPRHTVKRVGKCRRVGDGPCGVAAANRPNNVSPSTSP